MLKASFQLNRSLTNSHIKYVIARGFGSSWAEDFNKASGKICGDAPFNESANRLRELCKTDLVKGTDIRDAPDRFFKAHRILARHAVNAGPGFWVRFTVHYNLFAGTILGVGSDEQVAKLADYQKNGQLGCFALTEKLAGVQSGLVVQTTIEWDEGAQKFILNTPNEGARKNWISQGFTADKAVVVADLLVGGKSMGPHAFVMDFRRDGKLLPGISVDDMGRKTVGNDLDNAWIHFDKVELDKSAMLSKYAEINDENEYVLKTKGIRPFDMIGQRLYTGRIAVGQSALEYRRHIFKKTKEYSDNKPIFSFSGNRVLSSIPQLAAIYEENDEKLRDIDAFILSCEASLSDSIRSGATPSPKLVEAIATCKVKAVEESIEMCFRLKQEVGSYALIDDAGFGNMDFLQACKFAEGDSRILMQKMARDRFKQFVSTGGAGEDFTAEETKFCSKLGANIAASASKGVDKLQAWENEWRLVYKLAEAVMARVQANWDHGINDESCA
mmetsp:Transcript_44873/g.65956  ORF Transcript_44873/g.65956 Transcript_44873/m.65956 type:complete len:500 (+) Transcript_44873:33-1532(+)|eukprot:CAMPEP_0195516844 /NCGR_PEP_ID=MMETSP0794_2-20130614/8861_1 /TAXON_ID=515487 /ORGANISM="Stephanopyxis turris, Strain CCMP 815" /LENGTH=499 /DNA_ID=CAMNT_0040645545 /DNA_START=33 /DNA_END=1532 /DNA_ORIENTATION=+